MPLTLKCVKISNEFSCYEYMIIEKEKEKSIQKWASGSLKCCLIDLNCVVRTGNIFNLKKVCLVLKYRKSWYYDVNVWLYLLEKTVSLREKCRKTGNTGWLEVWCLLSFQESEVCGV